MKVFGPYSLNANQSWYFWFSWTYPDTVDPMVIVPEPTTVGSAGVAVTELWVARMPPEGSSWQSYLSFRALIENRSGSAQTFNLAVGKAT